MGSNVRVMTFGKYKGKPIMQVIAAHIGYIMWCFENIPWFSLNEDEQKFYDYQAIAIKKYGEAMIFPVELMYKHVKDQKALADLRTPYLIIRGNNYISSDVDIADLLRESGVMLTKNSSMPSDSFYRGIAATTKKNIESMDEDEINDMVYMGATPPFDIF